MNPLKIVRNVHRAILGNFQPEIAEVSPKYYRILVIKSYKFGSGFQKFIIIYITVFFSYIKRQ